MRILSQDGKWDIPYESAALYMDKNVHEKWVIYAQGNFVGNTPDNNFFGIAEYSTEEKAKKAMEMLHGAYCVEIYLKCGDYEVENIDLAQEIQKKIEEEMRKPHFLEIKPNNPMVECKIFQFPSDNEIEV